MKSLYFAFVFLLLAGCASGPRLDTSHPSANHDNRVQFVVVHYTSTNLERSLALLTHGQVSAHYLISDDAGATIYKLVDEGQRAWHAKQPTACDWFIDSGHKPVGQTCLFDQRKQTPLPQRPCLIKETSCT